MVITCRDPTGNFCWYVLRRQIKSPFTLFKTVNCVKVLLFRDCVSYYSVFEATRINYIYCMLVQRSAAFLTKESY